MSVYADEVAQIEGKKKAPMVEQLTAAARDSGLSPLKIALDFRKLKRGRGKLRFYEYLMYKLYDRSKYSDDARSRFISGHVHWPNVMPMNDQQWWAVTEDKWLSSAVLGNSGIPIPQNAAVFDTGLRSYPDLPKLSDVESLRSFLMSRDDFPLFAKNMNGMWSAGAFRITGCTETHVLTDGRDPMTYEEAIPELFGDRAYLIQKCVKPHSFFDGITTALPTVRCMNLIGKDGLKVPHTLIKLPMGGNIADNFWRKGNLVCHVDTDTGEVLRIVSNRNGELTSHDALPGTDRKFIGERLPHWDKLREVNAQVALLHAPNRYGSTDITITEEGPVVVEVNNGCGFELIQIATGKGLLTDEMLAFFRENGAPLK